MPANARYVNYAIAGPEARPRPVAVAHSSRPRHAANILAGLRRAGLTLLFLLVLAAPARAAIPNDPGSIGKPGGWQFDQWNFLPGAGVDAPRAWDNLIAAGKPGGKGVKIAVLDSGVAYANRGRFRKSPDLKAIRFAKGYDFCARTSNGLTACEG